MPGFSCDLLYELEQVRNLPGFSGADILEKGRLFYPTLRDLLVDARRRNENCVIDGEVILPELIPRLLADNPKLQIKCCFLGLSSTNLETIIEKGGYFNWPKWKLNNNLGHEVEDLAERTIQRSKIIEAEAAKYNMPYFDLANDYAQTTEQALKRLLA